MPGWLAPVLQFVTGDLLGQLRRAYEAKLAAETNIERLMHDERIKTLEAKLERQRTAKDFALGQMNHPVWWAAWMLFVLPVGVYHAAIYLVSTWPAIGWEIQRVPTTQEEWGRMIVLSIFGAQIVASGLREFLTK